LHRVEDTGYGGTVGVVLVGAQLRLFLIVVGFGVGPDVVLAAEAERTDDGEGHLAHAQFGRHGGEMALEGEVHQGSMDDIILMMAQGYLGAAEFLGEVEELLATLPGAEEARRLGFGR